MKRHRSGLVLLAMVYLMVSGCSGGKLTREKALSLLKEKEKDLQESLPQQMVTMRTDIWIPEANIENQQQRLAIKDFYEALHLEGLLTSPTTRPNKLVYDQGTDFFYFPVAGPDIEARQDAWLHAVVARGTFVEVTGLTGEGATCQADVRVELKPTETFRRMNRVYEKLKTKLGDPFIQGWLGGALPTEESLHSSRTMTVPLQKYDDGWRVMGPLQTASLH
ncbi:MAG TPA: hypothetical protein VF173_21475 [Thermoanaerobaculia bacterium]|nr:hypothetical protein [Thermoanaerobaculia bacterium]